MANIKKKKIISKDEKFYDAPKKSEEIISEKSKQESDRSIPKWMQVSEDRFNYIKIKINKSKNLVIMIGKTRYTLSDGNDFVNKIAMKTLAKVMPLKNAVIW